LLQRGLLRVQWRGLMGLLWPLQLREQQELLCEPAQHVSLHVPNPLLLQWLFLGVHLLDVFSQNMGAHALRSQQPIMQATFDSSLAFLLRLGSPFYFLTPFSEFIKDCF
jgi:hypothetical protein